MEFKNTQVFNFEGAFRSLRNPMNSWSKSDSNFSDPLHPILGDKDLELAQRLIRGGSEHRKYLRSIFVSVDITAPNYFTNELDTYKVGTTRNSCSLQHKGASRDFTINDFTVDDDRLYDLFNKEPDESIFISQEPQDIELVALFTWWENLLENINYWRKKYVETKDYKYFRIMRQLIPQSYNYTFTWTASYENIYSMTHQRKNHKLNEWSGKDYPEKPNFIAWARTLPYANELLFLDEKEETK